MKGGIRPKICFSVFPTGPKSAQISYCFHKNGSLRNFYIMTLNAHYKDSRSGCHSNSGSYDYTRESRWEEFTWYLFSPPLFVVNTGQCAMELYKVLYICVSWWLFGSWITSFISSWEKKLLLQAEQINFFHSKWSGLKKIIILTENSCHFVNLFSF